MAQGKQLLKSTLIYAIGNFGSKVLSFLLLPLYSFYLSKNEFGAYDLVIVTVNLLVPIITLQTSDSVYRWLIEAKEDEEKQSKIIFNGFCIITGVAIFFYLIYFISSFFIKFNYSAYFSVILLLSCYIPFLQKLLRGLGKSKIYAVSGILNTLLVLISNICFLYFFNFKLEGLFIASIISGAITMIYILNYIKVGKVFRIRNFDTIEIKDMVRYSLPLVPNSISWWLINASDKYIILYVLNVQANGIYAVSTRFPAIMTLVNSIFLLAWQDHGVSANDTEEHKSFFSKTFDKFITLELTVVIFLISISQYLIYYLIDSKYYEAWRYIPFLFLGVAFSSFSSYIGVAFLKAKKTKSILITSIISGLINIIISLCFMNKIGLYAPALGSFISFLAMYIIRKFQTNSFFKVEINNSKLTLLTFIAVSYSLLVLYENTIINIVLIISSIVLAVIMNWSVLLSLFKLFQGKLNITLKNVRK